MNKLKTLTALFMALFFSFSTAVYAAQLNANDFKSDDIRGKLVPIAKGALMLFEHQFSPNVAEHFSSLYSCLSDPAGDIKGRKTLKGVIDGTITFCMYQIDFILPNVGGVMAFEDKAIILWKDASGHTYKVDVKGTHTLGTQQELINYLSGIPQNDNDYYESYGGVFQTDNPALAHLNNTTAVLESQGVHLVEPGKFLDDFTIYVFDEDRKLLADDDSSS